MDETTPAQVFKWTQDVCDILSQPDLLVFWAHAQGVSVAHARRTILQSLAQKPSNMNTQHAGPNAIIAEDKARFASEHRVRLQYGASGSSSGRGSGRLYSDSTNTSTMSLGSNLGQVGSSSDTGPISKR
ncbi:uncharacterized protein SAPINGB_P002754 [Magnusiomyces paraingens]|uniref:Uncharacterized protein n=1 Tax=Magnusiomyces paraingens TaxID=2606893 RepID=A0A5E8BFU5_9ASCO|nr:uncharacterized protein SAPINGB_P002754 [Saprochaete ingens]VVT50420.1 unnamed protein product [Saprochaete ingens]